MTHIDHDRNIVELFAMSPDEMKAFLTQGIVTKGGAGSGNFGHEGRPGKVGGSTSQGGTSPREADKLTRAVREQGGFTYQPITNRSPKTGLALSIHPEREQIVKIDQLSALIVKEYVKRNSDLLRDKRNHLGGWYDTEHGVVFLDVSTLVRDREEAARLCRQYKQEAYFDLSTMEEVRIGAHEEMKQSKPKKFILPNDPTDEEIDEMVRKIKSKPVVITKGGSGSGNFDHEGRPGMVGGSKPSVYDYTTGQDKSIAKGDATELYRWANLTEVVDASVGKHNRSLDVTDKPEWYFSPVSILPESSTFADRVYGRYILDRDMLAKAGWGKDENLIAEGAWRFVYSHLGKTWRDVPDSEITKNYLKAIKGFEVVQLPTYHGADLQTIIDVLTYRLGRSVPVIFSNAGKITDPFQPVRKSTIRRGCIIKRG